MNSCSRMTGKSKSAFGQAVRQLQFQALAKHRRFGLADGMRVRMWHFCVMEIYQSQSECFWFCGRWSPLAPWANRVLKPP